VRSCATRTATTSRRSATCRSEGRAGRGLDLTERPVSADDVGGAPQPRHALPVALVRDGRRIAFDESDFTCTQAGDTVIYLGSPSASSAHGAVE
jgi:hypothetical protein